MSVEKLVTCCAVRHHSAALVSAADAIDACCEDSICRCAVLWRSVPDGATQHVAQLLGRIADASFCHQGYLRQALDVCCAVVKSGSQFQ